MERVTERKPERERERKTDRDREREIQSLNHLWVHQRVTLPIVFLSLKLSSPRCAVPLVFRIQCRLSTKINPSPPPFHHNHLSCHTKFSCHMVCDCLCNQPRKGMPVANASCTNVPCMDFCQLNAGWKDDFK